MTKPPKNTLWGKSTFNDFSSLCPTKELKLERIASEMDMLLGDIGLSYHKRINAKVFYERYINIIKEAISKQYPKSELDDFKKRYYRLLKLP